MKELLENNHLNIADIGASGGIHARWEKIAPLCDFFLFEPDERGEVKSFSSGLSGGKNIIRKAVSNKSEIKHLHLCRKQQVSSVYTPNTSLLNKYPASERFDVIKKVEIEAARLDELIDAEIDLVKIDVQGHELAVLEGMGKMLENVIGVEVEVSFIEIYNNQPLFFEIDRHLKQFSFEIYDLNRYFWRRDSDINYGENRGQLTFGEALYFKSPEEICNTIGCTQEKIIRAAWIYKSYGYYDLVETLANLSKNNNLVDETTYNTLIKDCQNEEISNFPILGRGRIQSDEIVGN